MSCKTILLLKIVCITLFTSFCLAEDSGYQPGYILVRFAPRPDKTQHSISERNEILSYFNAGTVKESTDFIPGLTLVELPDNVTVSQAIDSLESDSAILHVQPNFIYKSCSTFPNDEYFNDLWAMHNTGQTGGTSDSDIDAPEAWDIKTDANQIIVAVIDTGIDYNHPDLTDNMWVNEAELNGTPDYDDDEKGQRDRGTEDRRQRV